MPIARARARTDEKGGREKRGGGGSAEGCGSTRAQQRRGDEAPPRRGSAATKRYKQRPARKPDWHKTGTSPQLLSAEWLVLAFENGSQAASADMSSFMTCIKPGIIGLKSFRCQVLAQSHSDMFVRTVFMCVHGSPPGTKLREGHSLLFVVCFRL